MHTGAVRVRVEGPIAGGQRGGARGLRTGLHADHSSAHQLRGRLVIDSLDVHLDGVQPDPALRVRLHQLDQLI